MRALLTMFFRKAVVISMLPPRVSFQCPCDINVLTARYDGSQKTPGDETSFDGGLSQKP